MHLVFVSKSKGEVNRAQGDTNAKLGGGFECFELSGKDSFYLQTTGSPDAE